MVNDSFILRHVVITAYVNLHRFPTQIPMIALNKQLMVHMDIAEGNSTERTVSGPSEPGLESILKGKVNGLWGRLAF